MTLTFAFDLDTVKMNPHAKYRSKFISFKLLSGQYTDKHRHSLHSEQQYYIHSHGNPMGSMGSH